MQSIRRVCKEAEERHTKMKEARILGKANLTNAYSTSKLGDEKPSKMAMFWPRHGKKMEFPGFTTYPQQDHRKNNEGIKIHRATDKRAQPYNQLVRANVHSKPIYTIPSRDAKRKEVREYLYLVLTKSDLSTTADTKPWLVCATVNNWKGNGEKLRKLDDDYEKWYNLCPPIWVDVNKLVHYPTKEERTILGQHLKEAIAPIVTAEKKLEEIAGYHSADEETLTEEKRKKGKFSRVLRFMCLGSGCDDEQLPAYKEKMAS